MDFLLTILAKLLPKLPTWFQNSLRARKEARITKIKQTILHGFEQGQAKVVGRFCPSREEILQSMSSGTTQDTEEITSALTQLVQEGYIRYEGGRFYLS